MRIGKLRPAGILFWLLLATDANADWRYEVIASAFDGTKSERIYIQSDDLRAYLLVFSEKNGKVDAVRPSIALSPGLPYICNTSDYGTEYVEWLILDGSGKELHRESLSEWKIYEQKNGLYPNTKDRFKQYNSAQILLALMFDPSADEVRFRFTDDCGEESITKFSLHGFRESLLEMEKRSP